MAVIDAGGRSDAQIGRPGDEADNLADNLTDDLTDAELQSEIELVGDLLVAASGEPSQLSPSQIDRALGLGDQPRLPGQRRVGAERTE